MQIIFKNPATAVASPCVAEITSATVDEANSLLILYGYYNGKPAVFRVPAGAEGARVQLNHLYLESRASLYAHQSRIQNLNDTPIVIDFYR